MMKSLESAKVKESVRGDPHGWRQITAIRIVSRSALTFGLGAAAAPAGAAAVDQTADAVPVNSEFSCAMRRVRGHRGRMERHSCW
jgi:hypothetical protein